MINDISFTSADFAILCLAAVMLALLFGLLIGKYGERWAAGRERYGDDAVLNSLIPPDLADSGIQPFKKIQQPAM
jgi:hypothetical protein